jgi:endonuclease/exonuclease/phosphatase family metal-dependent hydrolase
MGSVVKRILVVIGAIIAALVLIVGGYVAYLMITYDRIPDNEAVEIIGNPTGSVLSTGTDYSAATYNIGFGAYTPDYTFFMDEGIMKDGAQTVGEHSVAVSKESVLACTEGAIETMRALNPDFALFQEVDTDSTRSYGVNQKEAIEAAFPTMGAAFAVNFHTAFLAYPPSEPHGIVNGGLLSLSNATIDKAVRRSYPVDFGFPTKFFDLDRCFLVERIPVENGKELVLINSHMSAYDEGGVIREQQLELIMGVLASEAAAGNYVIAGGDWNHSLCGSDSLYPSQQLIPPWLATFDESVLPNGFTVVEPDNLAAVATCRGADIPYEKGVTYTVTIDGFIVSDNVNAHAVNVDTGFQYSDHNPVLLTFSLK